MADDGNVPPQEEEVPPEAEDAQSDDEVPPLDPRRAHDSDSDSDSNDDDDAAGLAAFVRAIQKVDKMDKTTIYSPPKPTNGDVALVDRRQAYG